MICMKNAIKSIVGGVTYVTYYFKPLSKALLVPVAVSFLLRLAHLLPDLSRETVLFIDFLHWIPCILIAITTHKIILEGPDSVNTWGINRIGLREIKFALSQIVIVLFTLPAILLLYVPEIGFFLFTFAAAYMFGRMSLVFPGIATGNQMRFLDSWDATAHHQIMMFTAAIVFPLVVYFFERLLTSIPLVNYLSVIVSTVAIVYAVAVLSFAYKIVMESNENTAEDNVTNLIR